MHSSGAHARQVLGALVLTGLVTAGCTVNGDDGEAENGAADDTTDGGPVAGVTEDTVKLGFLAPDEDIENSLGLDAEGPRPELFMSAQVDAQNEEGGAAGRDIELVFEPYFPVVVDADAACVALTEDNPVFVAVGIMTGDEPLCFTEDHETAYLGMWGLSPERERRSRAPFLAMEMSDDRQRVAGIEALQEDGLLDGEVALYWEAKDTTMIEESVKPVLDEAGVDVVVETTQEEFGTDQAASDAAADVIAERIQTSGADTVLTLSGYGALLPAFQRAGWLPEQILGTTQQGLSADYNNEFGVTPESLANVTIAGQYTPTKDELLNDAGLEACLDNYAAADPDMPDPASVTREWLNGAAGLCGAFELFVDAAEAAEGDLTPSTWAAGAESLGTLELPGIPFGSLGEGKHSVNDGVGVYTYDAESGGMVATDPPAEAGV